MASASPYCEVNESEPSDELIVHLMMEKIIPGVGAEELWEEGKVRVRAPNKKDAWLNLTI